MDDELRSPNDPRWGQENREAKADAIIRTLQLHCGDLPRGLWLDIGCGSGGIAASLAPFADKVIGVDPESWERWNAYRECNPNLEFHIGGYRDLTKLLGNESCDVVICNQVYEHVDDPLALLQAIYAILKPKGICYFAGPNLLWPIEPHVFWPFVHWLPRAFAQRAMRALGSRHAAELDAYSTHYWHLSGWFREAGFICQNAIRARLLAAPHVSGVLRGVLRIATAPVVLRTLTPLAPGFVFVLRKPGCADPST